MTAWDLFLAMLRLLLSGRARQVVLHHVDAEHVIGVVAADRLHRTEFGLSQVCAPPGEPWEVDAIFAHADRGGQ